MTKTAAASAIRITRRPLRRAISFNSRPSGSKADKRALSREPWPSRENRSISQAPDPIALATVTWRQHPFHQLHAAGCFWSGLRPVWKGRLRTRYALIRCDIIKGGEPDAAICKLGIFSETQIPVQWKIILISSPYWEIRSGPLVHQTARQICMRLRNQHNVPTYAPNNV